MIKTRLALAAALTLIASAANAAVFDTAHYTVVTNDSVLVANPSFVGSITGNGQSGNQEWFSWNLLDSNLNARFYGGSSPNAFIAPGLTITAKSGYSLSNFQFYVNGGQYGAGSLQVDPHPMTNLGTRFGDFTTSFAAGSNNNAVSTAIYGNAFAREAGYRFTVSAVPEPETYAMMLAGLGVMGFIARRRKAA